MIISILASFESRLYYSNNIRRNCKAKVSGPEAEWILPISFINNDNGRISPSGIDVINIFFRDR